MVYVIPAMAWCRLCLAIFTIFTATFMIGNEQFSTVGEYTFHAYYKESRIYEFFVYMNLVAGLYSLLFAIILFINKTRINNILLACEKLVFLLDLVVLELMLAATSQATALGFVVKYGNDKNIGWPKICHYANEFCKKTGGALITSYLGCITILGISIFLNYPSKIIENQPTMLSVNNANSNNNSNDSNEAGTNNNINDNKNVVNVRSMIDDKEKFMDYMDRLIAAQSMSK